MRRDDEETLRERESKKEREGKGERIIRYDTWLAYIEVIRRYIRGPLKQCQCGMRSKHSVRIYTNSIQ